MKKSLLQKWCITLIFGLLAFQPGAFARQSDHPVNVVLVHGFWRTGEIFDPLVAILQKQGCNCFAPNLVPNDFRDGVHAESLRLKEDIDAHFGPKAPIVFVCMSAGGLAARDYVENLGGAARTRAMFFISTPHRGTIWAPLSPQKGVHDLGAGGAFVRALNAHADAMRGIPVHAYWTPFDVIVLPATNSRWLEPGHSDRVWCLSHSAMVRHPFVLADIAARIRALQSDLVATHKH